MNNDNLLCILEARTGECRSPGLTFSFEPTTKVNDPMPPLIYNTPMCGLTLAATSGPHQRPRTRPSAPLASISPLLTTSVRGRIQWERVADKQMVFCDVTKLPVLTTRGLPRASTTEPWAFDSCPPTDEQEPSLD